MSVFNILVSNGTDSSNNVTLFRVLSSTITISSFWGVMIMSIGTGSSMMFLWQVCVYMFVAILRDAIIQVFFGLNLHSHQVLSAITLQCLICCCSFNLYSTSFIDVYLAVTRSIYLYATHTGYYSVLWKRTRTNIIC